MPTGKIKMPKSKTNVRVSIDLPKALRNRIDEAAALKGHSFASAARIALRQWADDVLSEKDALSSS